MSTLEQDVEKLKKDLAELKAKSDETKRDEDKKRYNEFRRKHYKHWKDYEGEEPDNPTDNPPTPVEDGRPQPKKGANKDPNTWKVVNMKDDPALFKIVDAKGINVADLFHSKDNAEAYVKKAIRDWTYPPTPCPAGQHRDQAGNCVPDVVTPPTGGLDETVGPYAQIGTRLASTQRGPTVRHYASGKPDDKTIEKNVKEIDYDNYQWVTFVTMNSIQHDDNISLKLGGTHMGSGWFDNGVSFKEGKCCLGYEPDHPETHTCVIKGPSVGSVLNKKVGVACTYFKKINKTELWTNLGDGWKKQMEAADVGGFNPNSEVNEAQLRIDGFEAVPTIHAAWVTEIAG